MNLRSKKLRNFFLIGLLTLLLSLDLYAQKVSSESVVISEKPTWIDTKSNIPLFINAESVTLSYDPELNVNFPIDNLRSHSVCGLTLCVNKKMVCSYFVVASRGETFEQNYNHASCERQRMLEIEATFNLEIAQVKKWNKEFPANPKVLMFKSGQLTSVLKSEVTASKSEADIILLSKEILRLQAELDKLKSATQSIDLKAKKDKESVVEEKGSELLKTGIPKANH